MPKKFVKENNSPSYPLGVTVGVDGTEGEVGLELEFEGKNLPKGPVPDTGYANHPNECPDGWEFELDGSLRGGENAEYVLSSPIPFSEVGLALDSLWAVFEKKGSIFDDSNRTSVHVHLNCQNFYLNRLTSFAGLYFCFEDLLTNWSGEYREGNMFCLRVRDASAIAARLRDFIKSDGQTELSEQHLHYAGFNTSALFKYGSVEIRSLRGCSDKKVILDWVEMLQRLYEYSDILKDPRMVCQMFSGSGGGQNFLTLIFGPKAETLRKGLTVDVQTQNKLILDGVRKAQDICYCRDWSKYKQAKLDPDPFGRQLHVIASKLKGAGPSTLPPYAPAIQGQAVYGSGSPITFDDL